MPASWQWAARLCSQAWILWLLPWHASAAVKVGLGGSIPEALELARATGDTEVQVAAGVYPTAGARLFLEIDRSLHLRGVGGVAVIDCGGEGSAIDVVLRTGINVTFSDVAFLNCTSQAAAGLPARLWGDVSQDLGPSPVASWCDGCWCAVQLCSKGGAVTISSAFADASGGPDILNASVSFLRCDFFGNRADKGGAVAVFGFSNLSDSALRFEDCRFEGNRATSNGGAAIDVMADWAYNLLYYQDVYGDKHHHTTVWNRTNFTLQRCVFKDNVGDVQGAVSFWSVAAIIDDLKFTVASSAFVGNQGGNGAGIHLQVGRTGPSMTNTFLLEGDLFERNVARDFAVGGAVLSTLPAAETNPNPPRPQWFRNFTYPVRLITRNTVFKENRAFNGGAYTNGNGFHQMHNVSFLRNVALNAGGAWCSNCESGGDARLDLQEVVFEGNSAKQRSSTFGVQGSGPINLKNCSFDLAGSAEGVTDFATSKGGEFRADSHTSWRCRPNQRMLRNVRTVSWGVDSNSNPAYNGESMDLKASSMSLSCIDCPINQFTRLKSDMFGPVFVYINSSYDPGAVVEAQGTGTFTQQQCVACPNGEFVENGACRRCPLGMSLTGDGVMTLQSCQHNVQYVTYMAILFCILTATLLCIPVLLGLPILIKDISFEHGQLVVATCGRHHLLQWSWCQPRVWLRDTGHPLLDDKKAVFRACALDSERLVLCGESGEPLSERRDSSMGYLRVDSRRAPLCMGFSQLPIGIIASALIAAVVVIMRTQGADARDSAVLFALACLVSALRFAWVQWTTSTPIARRLLAFRTHALAALKPKPCDRGPERAMSAGKLLDFYGFFQEFLKDRDMYYACANLIKPLTQPERLSFAELVGPARIQYFVSHFWGMQVRHLVESVAQHARHFCGGADWRDCTYWVCSFANNQWKLAEELPGACTDSSFYVALRDTSCRGTAMLLDEAAEPLQRSWCLFELLQTFLLREERRGKDFVGLALCTSGGVLNSGGASVDVAMGVATRLATLDLERARASRDEDKKMIDDQVRLMEGGFPAMNSLLRSCMREALTRVKDNFEGSFAQIVAALEQQQAVPALSPEAALPSLLGNMRVGLPPKAKPRLSAADTRGPEADDSFFDSVP